MFYIPDYVCEWEEHDRQKEEALNKLPKCCECGERIQSDELYEFNDELICPDCLIRNHRKWVEDYCE